MTHFRSVAARDAYVWAFGLVLLAVLAPALSGCGAAQDYTNVALGYADQASANTIMDLQQANDGELRGIAAAYCGVPRIGAVARRYQDPATLALRQQMCAAEAQIGFVGP